jgi:hypothetical protein
MATTTFDNLITFSRGSNATVTGPNGLIQWAPNNLQIQSETFNDVAWGKAGSTISANIGVAPFGSTTADKIVEDTSTGVHEVSGTTLNITPGQTYAATFFLKADGRSLVRVMQTWNGTTDRVFADFDLSNGSVGAASTQGIAVSAAPPVITNLGNGWYRCQISGSCPTGTTLLFYARMMSAAGVVSYTGDGSSGVQIWGAQLELGSTATTYNNTSVRNLLGFSEAFDNAAWTKNNASIVTGAQANPVNGLFNAQKVMENTVNAWHGVRQAASTGLVGVFSFYVKAAERSRVWVAGDTPDFVFAVAVFNLATGTVQSGTGSIQSVGNGWWRCSIPVTVSARGCTISVANDGGAAIYTGDGNSGVYIYGAQLSNSASLDPYVPTPGAAPSSTAYYGPRFDYDPVTLLPRGLLIEEQRTNLATYSEQFDNAAWTKVNATVTANATVSPDGTVNADKLAEDATASVGHLISQGPTLTAVAHTYSVYAKASERNWICLLNNSIANALAFFNIATGTIGTVGSGATATITNVGNGWYRCSITFTAIAATNNCHIRLAPSDNVLSYNGVAGNGAFIWGAQLEAGAFATSYIPTIASTVTRSADNATITGSLFSQWYRQPEGTLIAEFSGPSGGYPVNMTDGTNNNATGLVYLTGTTLRGITVVSGSGRFVDMTASASPAINKTAYGYRLNDLGGSTNGGTVLTNTTAPIPTLDRMFIGTFSNFSYLNGHIRSIRYVPVRAADFQLQQVTT